MEVINILKKKVQTANRVNAQNISLSISEVNDIFSILMKKDEEIISLQKQLINKKEDIVNIKINPTM